jgi:hypothetical protein
MIRVLRAVGSVAMALLFVSTAYAAEDVVHAIHGTIEKVDATTKTMVVKTGDGAERSLHFLNQTTVHGGVASAEAAKDSWRGLKRGTEVVAHYTTRGTEDTTLEIDKLGKGGLKTTEATIRDLDRSGRTMVVKAADGTESTFRLTDHAAEDAGKEIADGTEKGTAVTVYYSEDAGGKVAHFFERG